MNWKIKFPVAVNMSNTSLKTTGEWHSLNWRKLERRVYKLQQRIYRASQRGDVKTYRRLQKTLMNSWSARVLAVRRVTQDNRGKKTAGVDGVKSLTPKQRLKLTSQLKLGSSKFYAFLLYLLYSLSFDFQVLLCYHFSQLGML